MRVLYSILFLLLASSCSIRSDLARKYAIEKKTLITSVPFIAQEDFECGPASLAMVLRYRGKNVSTEELVTQAFTPGKKGSLQADMVTAVRRQAHLPVPVDAFQNLLVEVNAANPVIVLQNLGFKWFPRWHYAVVIGYDLKDDKIILHSGDTSNQKMSFRTFEKTWKRSQNWGFVIMEPGKVSASSSEMDMVEAAASLENAKFLEEAMSSYKGILKKWPGSLGAMIGIGNVLYNQDKFKEAALILKKVTQKYPLSAIAWHNYAWALKASSMNDMARSAANRALALPKDELLPTHRQNLKEFLKSKL